MKLHNEDGYIQKGVLFDTVWDSIQDGKVKTAKDILTVIHDMPTANVVEVVRCKDCKWYAPNNDGFWYGCAFDTRLGADRPSDNDFCSYGERKVQE